MRKILPISHFLIMMIITGITAFIWVHAHTNILEVPVHKEKIELSPIVQQLSPDLREYDIPIGEADPQDSSLGFFSCHQEVRVYADETLVYQVLNPESPIAHTTGALWNFVEIPQGTKEVQIQVKAIVPPVRQSEMEFYMGNGTDMFHELLRDSLLEGIVSLLDIAIGLFLLAYGWSIRKLINSKLELFYFGLVALIIGIWSLNETYFSVLLLQNRTASSFLAYICLMFVVPNYVLFIRYSLGIKDNWLSTTICIISYCNLFVCTILELTGIRSFRENLMIIFVLIGIALCYATGTVIWGIYENWCAHLSWCIGL